jgi:hypothetical protein
MIRRVQPYERPAPRLALVLHYVIARTVGCDFGAIKINKAVVEADSEFYRRYGRTITGAEAFQKQQFGPVPNGVLKAIGTLRRQKKISSSPVQTPSGEREEYVALEEPSVGEFSAAEIDVLNVAIARLLRFTARGASERTHDALWDEIPMFGQIPIRAAAFKPGEVDAEVLTWALSDGR